MTEPDGPPEAARRSAIEAELKRLEESAMYSGQMQFEMTKQWRGVNLGLGLPASVLAAISGAAALASTAGRVPAGILALVASGLGAILTTINASHRMNQAAAAANAYLEIQTAARQAREIDLSYWSIDEARQALAELTARRDEQNKTAEPPNKRAYKRAQSNIDSGGQTYAVDETTTTTER
ncbi:SLATT domain-containing protein [Kitasatospora sp. NPDC058046]|uniref:SLATT domain-containing protein n=1 Tax=Kitasatospora sp. NPDC058046 TaxID=3346312 RepID=UPI0036DC5D78